MMINDDIYLMRIHKKHTPFAYNLFMKNIYKSFPLFLVLLGILHFTFYFPVNAGDSPQRVQISLISTEGKIHKFHVELAISEKQKEVGLMFRKELASDAGMLFIWNSESHRQFWMKNTHISLDILFIDADKRVVHIEKNAPIGSEKIIPSILPVQYVLEIKAGQSELRNITPGAILSGKNLLN
ncbi:DUF192 domain-containing protein [Alphaproteobacteria bacterium]|nr:DUF192 domain-containing protein [Alphaproteobacteria bacterium]